MLLFWVHKPFISYEMFFCFCDDYDLYKSLYRGGSVLISILYHYCVNVCMMWERRDKHVTGHTCGVARSTLESWSSISPFYIVSRDWAQQTPLPTEPSQQPWSCTYQDMVGQHCLLSSVLYAIALYIEHSGLKTIVSFPWLPPILMIWIQFPRYTWWKEDPTLTSCPTSQMPHTYIHTCLQFLK